MNRVKTARKKARSAITKTITTVETELAKEDTDLVVAEALLQTLDKLSDKLSDLNEEMTTAMLDADCTDAEHEAESDLAEEYSTKISVARIRLNQKLNPKPRSPSPSESSSASANTGRGKKTFKLPKVELKKFSGELTEWLGWWSQFRKIDEDDDLHDSDKFQYLIQCMTLGSASRALVERYPQSSENYPKVIKALKERFGKDKLLRQVYIRELIKMIISQSRDKSGKATLSTLYDQLYSHLHSLDSLGKVTDPNEFLFPMVESSLPQEILVAWQRSPLHDKDGSQEDPPRSELNFLMEFLQKEINCEQERTLAKSGFGLMTTESKKDSHRENHNKKYHEKVTTAAGLFSGESKALCLFCDKKHDTDKCVNAQSMSLEDKRSKLRNRRACFQCFKTNHQAKVCRAFVKCIICGQKHNALLCPGKSEAKSKSLDPSAPEFVSTTTTNLDCTNEVVLQTLMVRIRNDQTGKDKVVRALIDTGSQRSYILRSTSNKLGFQPKEKVTLHHLLFGGNHVAGKLHNLVDVGVHSTYGDFSTTIRLLDQEQICGAIPRAAKGPWMSELREKNINVNDLSRENSTEIEVLLGADTLGSIFTGKIVPLSNGLTATKTRLGWTLMGQVKSKDPSGASSVISMHLTTASMSELWKLEAIGIDDPAQSRSRAEKDLAAKAHFKKTVSQNEEGRYSVSLPWIDGRKEIPDNKCEAEKRLKSTTKKLLSNGFFGVYQEIFTAWEKEGIISQCSRNDDRNNKFHYIPHRAVLKPESKTTPVRPVFDASCKLGRSPSLNDCLEKGPNLLELIPSILMRFRIGKIGFISDIRKAFLMIEVNDEDRSYLRFLWWEDQEKESIKILQHNRVVFGMNCSPFLLGAVIEHHLDNVENNQDTAQKLVKSLYVDNCVSSLDNYE